MARSLTVAQEESPRANWLLIGFVLLAVGFLALGAVVTMASADDVEAPVVAE